MKEIHTIGRNIKDEQDNWLGKLWHIRYFTGCLIEADCPCSVFVRLVGKDKPENLQ